MNLAFTTTSVARYQKVSCGILGYLGISCGSGTLLKPTCRATHQVCPHRPGLARSQQGQSTRPFRSSRKRFQHRIQADGVHETKNLNCSKISATFSLVTCVFAPLITWRECQVVPFIDSVSTDCAPTISQLISISMLNVALPPRETEFAPIVSILTLVEGWVLRF